MKKKYLALFGSNILLMVICLLVVLYYENVQPSKDSLQLVTPTLVTTSEIEPKPLPVVPHKPWLERRNTAISRVAFVLVLTGYHGPDAPAGMGENLASLVVRNAKDIHFQRVVLASALTDDTRVLFETNGFKIVDYTALEAKSRRALEFKSMYPFVESNYDQYVCWSRWLVLEQYMADNRATIDGVVLADNDVLFLDGFANNLAYMVGAEGRSGLCCIDGGTCSGHESMWTEKALVDFNDFALERYLTKVHADKPLFGWHQDMHGLREWHDSPKSSHLHLVELCKPFELPPLPGRYIMQNNLRDNPAQLLDPCFPYHDSSNCLVNFNGTHHIGYYNGTEWLALGSLHFQGGSKGVIMQYLDMESKNVDRKAMYMNF